MDSNAINPGQSADSKRILLVEDEAKLARFVELELKYEGYTVDIAYDGRDAIDMFVKNKYSLVLLDLMLPGINGLEVLRRIRKLSDVPVIMLTAKGEVSDKVVGLDSGADDYITKPFAIEEVLARMRVAFKKSAQKEDKNICSVRQLVIDMPKREAKWGDTSIDLTKTEFDLLVYMIQNKNIVLTREQILNHVWGYDYIGETNVVDVYIRYLRTKIDDRFNEKIIYTTRGVGYYVRDGQ
ncbi:MAG: response regulator transcription factor [Clostridiales bacterium]|jgi:DNA-binding response OmpR family regulator|nr:response regulator transcription factor [Clostridiales bacterium]